MLIQLEGQTMNYILGSSLYVTILCIIIVFVFNVGPKKQTANDLPKSSYNSRRKGSTG